MLKQFLEAGKVVGMHGVRGEMRFDVWCDGADFLKKIKTLYLDADGKRAVGVVSVRPHKNAALLKLDGVLTIEEAEKYRGRVLYFDRKDVHLDSGKAFVEDVIGCAVYDADNTDVLYGAVTDVMKGVANDAWTVKDKNGKETLVPVIPSVVVKLDVENKKVYLRPLKGLFSDECAIREDGE